MNIAEKVLQLKQDFDNVYEAGKAAGGGDNYYDTFWDNFQDYGNRTNYYRTFMYYWDDNGFAPKYNIQPMASAQEMFYGCEITNLKGICEKQGVTLDFSKATGLSSLFYQSAVTKVGTIDLSSASNANQMFYKCGGLESVDLMVCLAKHTFSNTFSNCSKLKEIRFSGEIGNSINLQHSLLLSNESVQSIIDGLINLAEDKYYFVGNQISSDTYDYATNEVLVEDITEVVEEPNLFMSDGATIYRVTYNNGQFMSYAYKRGSNTTQVLQLHADVGAKLTDTQKATITAKNWTLVY